jgi:hypothetical protein
VVLSYVFFARQHQTEETVLVIDLESRGLILDQTKDLGPKVNFLENWRMKMDFIQDIWMFKQNIYRVLQCLIQERLAKERMGPLPK